MHQKLEGMRTIGEQWGMQSRVESEMGNLLDPVRGISRGMAMPMFYGLLIIGFMRVVMGPLHEPPLRTPAGAWRDILESAAIVPEDVKPLLLARACEEHEDCRERCAQLLPGRSRAVASRELRQCYWDLSQSYAPDVPNMRIGAYVNVVEEALRAPW